MTIKQNEPITHIMTKHVITINTKTPLSDVAKIFSQNNFHHLPVVSGKELIGMLSYLDLMRVSFEDSFGVTDKQAVYDVLDHTLTVEAVMTKDPVVVREKDSIKRAAELLSSGDFHSLPVVNDEHELVGIVTSADMIKFLMSLY
jgi:CBS domain-containing protein